MDEYAVCENDVSVVHSGEILTSQCEPTQVEFGSLEAVSEEQIKNAKEQQIAQKKPWVRLVSLDPNVPHRDIFPNEVTETIDGAHCFNIVSLGRSKKNDISFESLKVSNVHCRLFCKKVYSPYADTNQNSDYFEVWISDNSANGTYINRYTRLKKNVPRLLRTGDEISLINFALIDAAMASRSSTPESVEELRKEIESHAFLVMLSNGQPPVAQTKSVSSAVSMLMDIDGEGEGLSQEPNPQRRAPAEVHRTSTVVRMLNESRNINDFYTLTKVLGTGGCGIVYEAINRYTGLTYAVKRVDMRKLSPPMIAADGGKKGNDNFLNDTAVAQLIREAEMLRALKHKSIVHLEDVFADESCLYIVMELLTGGDLFERIQARGVYKENAAREVIVRLLEALVFLHSKQVAHRDLKPENILLVSANNDFEVKLTDFGLAKQTSNSTKLKTYCGTPQYLAPEVYDRLYNVKAGAYSVAADMWSLGVVLYVMLSASYPFPDNGPGLPRELLNAKFGFPGRESGGQWSGVSDDCKHFIRCCIEKDPQKRPSAADCLHHPWITGRRAVPASKPAPVRPSPSKALPPPPANQNISVTASLLQSMNNNMKFKEDLNLPTDSMTLMPPPSSEVTAARRGARKNLDAAEVSPATPVTRMKTRGREASGGVEGSPGDGKRQRKV